VNPLVAAIEGVRMRLEKEEVRVIPTEFGPFVFQVLQGAPQLTKSFAEGEFYIQDPAIELLANHIEPKEESRILEVAAAPGGKTVQLAARIQERGLIVSVDAEISRMKLWEMNRKRMKVRSARGVVADARFLPFDCEFDQVIVDAPCSSLGVIRRHPEIKWWRREEDLAMLSQLQLQILNACAKYVRDQGEIVYMVCSFEPEETVQVLDQFLSENPNFQKTDAHFLLPHQQKTDGFFQAKLKRSAS
jgi:16S rRNA (cytosine967-C5)-methyltransferase